MYTAIDIGGTKTLIALFDDGGKITEQIKFLTPLDYNEFLDLLSKSVAKLSTNNFGTIVVAAPGRIDRVNGVVIAFGNLDWTNVNLVGDIGRLLAKNNGVYLENDAKLAALSEALLVKDSFSKVLYITISTGIGGGLIVDGVINAETSDMEPGQMLLEYRGKLKCWEDFASGRAFTEKFGTTVGETSDDNYDAWYWLSRNIALGLMSLAANLDPEIIVIGGGAGSNLHRFKGRLDEQLKIYESPMFSIPVIAEAIRPHDAVIYGCYELARQNETKISTR